MLFTAKQLHEYVNANRYHRSYVWRQLANKAEEDRRPADRAAFYDKSNSYTLPTIKECEQALKFVKDALTTRTNRSRIYELNLAKWLRPWDVVESLRDFSAPAGDFGVGIEVEHNFQNGASATFIARRIKNWKYVAMDNEGGNHGIEVTFAPTLYSKFGRTSQAMRYLDLLKENHQHTRDHAPTAMVGTHVNVSPGGGVELDDERIDAVNRYLSGYLTADEAARYFGRRPYGYGYNQGKYIEWKLFNSTADSAKLRLYVECAVALTKLVVSDERINMAAVLESLEGAYQRACKKNRTTPQPALSVNEQVRDEARTRLACGVYQQSMAA